MRAKIMVKARGLKYLPSTDSKLKMGVKTIAIMSIAKKTGLQTSFRESRTTANFEPSFFR